MRAPQALIMSPESFRGLSTTSPGGAANPPRHNRDIQWSALLSEEFFRPIEKAFSQRRIFFTAQAGEFFQFLSLLGVEFGRDLYHHPNEQIAVAVAIDVYHAFAAELEDLSGLRPSRNFHRGSALQRRNSHLPA
jgi:hypothetical protein